MSIYNAALFPQEEGGCDHVYGENVILKRGCLKPGHEGQPLLHIFINPKDQSQESFRFGCAECVCERSGERVLSLISVMNIPPKMSLYNFPELNPRTKKMSNELMTINNALVYDQTITSLLDDLYDKLIRIFDAKKDEALAFVLQIKCLGEKAKAVYRERTNCNYIREAFEAGEENITQKLESAIEKMYKDKPAAENDLLNVSNAYNSKLQQFQTQFVLEVQKRLSDTISRIVFNSNLANKQAQLGTPEHGVEDIAAFQHSGVNNEGYKDILQELQFENIKPKSQKLAAKITNFAISRLENNVISLQINQTNDVISQINSTTPLDPYLTYKIVFEVTQAPLIPNNVNPFLVGVGPIADKEAVCYEKSPYQKVFLTPQEYNKGLSYVQYGVDIGRIEREEQRRFVFKFCLAKNLFKFMDEEKKSLNVLSSLERTDLTKQYCLFILNQIKQFELRIISAKAK